MHAFSLLSDTSRGSLVSVSTLRALSMRPNFLLKTPCCERKGGKERERAAVCTDGKEMANLLCLSRARSPVALGPSLPPSLSALQLTNATLTFSSCKNFSKFTRKPGARNRRRLNASRGGGASVGGGARRLVPASATTTTRGTPSSSTLPCPLLLAQSPPEGTSSRTLTLSRPCGGEKPPTAEAESSAASPPRRLRRPPRLRRRRRRRLLLPPPEASPRSPRLRPPPRPLPSGRPRRCSCSA